MGTFASITDFLRSAEGMITAVAAVLVAVGGLIAAIRALGARSAQEQGPAPKDGFDIVLARGDAHSQNLSVYVDGEFRGSLEVGPGQERATLRIDGLKEGLHNYRVQGTMAKELFDQSGESVGLQEFPISGADVLEAQAGETYELSPHVSLEDRGIYLTIGPPERPATKWDAIRKELGETVAQICDDEFPEITGAAALTAFAERNMEQLGLRREDFERLTERAGEDSLRALLAWLNERGWVSDDQRKRLHEHLDDTL